VLLDAVVFVTRACFWLSVADYYYVNSALALF